MLTTHDLLVRLRKSNPSASVTEDRVRHALRRGDVLPPTRFGGRFAWTDAEARALADALGLEYQGGAQ